MQSQKLPTCCLIESPFQGKTPEETEANLAYLYECITRLYCEKQLTPLALHAIYPLLPDGKLHQDTEVVKTESFSLPGRDHALLCNKSWRKQVKMVVFCLDKGISSGMGRALQECKTDNTIAVYYWFLHLKEDAAEEVLCTISKTYGYEVVPGTGFSFGMLL
jgi:hypothetical protein